MPWGQGSPNWQPGRLAWVDLNSTATTTTNGQTNPTPNAAFGFLDRTGDPHPAAAFPTWSHDGKSIVYVSVACPNPGQQNGCGTQDGRLYKGAADLYEAPIRPVRAEGWSEQILSLPMYPALSEGEVAWVADALKHALSR